MDRKISVVMLCGHGLSSRVMFHAMAPGVDIQCVIVENKPRPSIIVRRRMKKLGAVKVAGQLLFLLFNKILSRASRARAAQLVAEYQLDDSPIRDDLVINVESVNDEDVINLLKKFRPDAVVVNGTRILSERLLSSIDAPFINSHMGITPKYRGVHGGYWALAMADGENCGVTVHLVDRGVDTGGVLYQDVIHVDGRDNFNTYPIHQLATAIPLMRAALDDVMRRNLKVRQGVSPSRLWYHPTLLEYLKFRITQRVK